MSYPKDLLPCKNFKNIECSLVGYTLSRSIFFIEGLPTTNGSGELSLNYIAHNKGQLIDYSTNLLGIFLPEHHKYKLIRESGVTNYCQPDEDPTQLREGSEYEILAEFDYFEFPIDQELFEEIEFENPDDQTILQTKVHIRHTPNWGNFWHFSVDWFKPPELETLLTSSDAKKKSKWIKHLYDGIKKLIQSKLIYPAEGNVNILPEAEYCK